MIQPNTQMPSRKSIPNPQCPRQTRGFTLFELLAVIAVLALLVSVIGPALGGTRADSRALRCRHNLKLMMEATLLYTYDFHELFPPNPDDGTTLPGYVWCAGQAGIGGVDEFNPDILRDPKRTLVAPYLNFNADVFRCTADPRTGQYTGGALYPTSPLKGKEVPASRSISMNNAVGTIDPSYSSGVGHSGVPNLPVNGPWLTGSYGANSAANGPWRTYGKTSQMVAPRPSTLWVLTEENPLSINDAVLATSAGSPVWIDYPSTLHNSSCALAFGDGHCEPHRWVEPTTVLTGFASARSISTHDVDWSWLAARTSARK
ncbi:MAG TPA: type II secretion system protein [Verrucomicrobiae bacterium]|nr:type II secretion system protein [Verrucomicrobiae bacterium]